MIQDLTIYHQRANIDVTSPETLKEATSTLSWLNTQLDTITAHKEKKTRPALDTLKAIRADYKPAEDALNTAIDRIRLAMTRYATEQAQLSKAQEERILADKRTTLNTKINKLATVENITLDKVTTDNGSITFTTVKKYTLTDHTKLTKDEAIAILELNTTALKAYLKAGNKLPEGITETEEQSIRNYR